MIRLASNKPQIGQEELNKLLYSAQQLEQQAGQYQKQLEVFQSYLADMNNAEKAMKELKNISDEKNILVPIGAGNFIHASVKKTEKVISSLGAGVHAEIPIDQALANIEKRKADVNNQISQVQASYNQVIERLKEIDSFVRMIQQG
ncbi:prefoldin subunit alpha [Candidatus Pacearchaeota archaeon]|nr:MAG: prefoldin subunit alpha [Candidatus Pacearchaeota archaeon]